MLITVNEYKKYFKWHYAGFWFRDCVVRDKDIFVFVTEPSLTDEQVEEEEKNDWDPNLRTKGIIIYVRDEPLGKQWSAAFRNWNAMVIGASQKPASHSVSIERTSVYPSLDLRCFVTGSGPAHEDTPLGREGDFDRGHIGKLKSLEGYLYACGGGRSFGKRLGDGQWQSFSQDIPLPDGSGKTAGQFGFEDFDGWSETDIYAAGGRGDVWHYDGKKWRQLPFPSNIPLTTVCCGGDGNVYISGYGGNTFMGGGDRWKHLSGMGLSGALGLSLPFRDMVWYEDRVWCTNDYGLWTIHKGRMKRADVPTTVRACGGNLSTADGVLLLAGLYGAVFMENGQWNEIVIFDTMEKILALEEMEKNGK
ncbi:MAG: hypothetical protein LBF61_03335 [Azoarcus sp.]|jgi:hypothetical protein|nr:hypothetical protein [Azoarcus sp.]